MLVAKTNDGRSPAPFAEPFKNTFNELLTQRLIEAIKPYNKKANDFLNTNIGWETNTDLVPTAKRIIFSGYVGVLGLQLRKLMTIGEEDYSESKLVINNADEIGELAKAFTSMAGTIRHNINDLEASKEIAIKANQSKEEFLENMSHEIRTPMNSIVGMTNLLINSELQEQQRKYLNIIKKASENLLVIINDKKAATSGT